MGEFTSSVKAKSQEVKDILTYLNDEFELDKAYKMPNPLKELLASVSVCMNTLVERLIDKIKQREQVHEFQVKKLQDLIDSQSKKISGFRQKDRDQEAYKDNLFRGFWGKDYYFVQEELLKYGEGAFKKLSETPSDNEDIAKVFEKLQLTPPDKIRDEYSGALNSLRNID